MYARTGLFTLVYPLVSVPPHKMNVGDNLLSISIINPPVSSHRLCLAVQLLTGQETHFAVCHLSLTPKTPAKQNKTNKKRKTQGDRMQI